MDQNTHIMGWQRSDLQMNNNANQANNRQAQHQE